MSDLAERAQELAQNLLVPLVLGGALRPVRPIGARLAMELGKAASLDSDLALRVDVARVRRARLIAPVDVVEELGLSDWALLAALNDLLQVTHHDLGGPLTRGRYPRLLANVVAVVERVPRPRTLGEALSRHATFAQALDMTRTDSTVTWWTGSAKFRGAPPPPRLLAWREWRRVHVEATRVKLGDMVIGARGVDEPEFHETLALWLTRSPMTDVATLARPAPIFSWSESTLSLVATVAGRALAIRALLWRSPDGASRALARALSVIPSSLEEARRVATEFGEELEATIELAHGRSPAVRSSG